jgi:ribosomal protein S27E
MTPPSSPDAASPAVEPAPQARRKFACPACGGEAQWDPRRQALECGYCGTVSPHQLSTEGEILEHDLVAALRAVPAQDRGWSGERRQVRCQHCHAISVFAAAQQGRACDFCGATALVPFDEGTEVIRPQSLLPFRLGEPQARDVLLKWYGSRFWAPNAFRRRVLTDTLRGVYLPYWTFDAEATAHYTAEAGTYYRDKDNRQRVRWSAVAGEVRGHFDDTLVCGSRGVHAGLIRAIEPFPTTTDLLPYDAGYLSGWTVERYALDLKGAAEQGRQRMQRALEQRCVQDIRADTHRNLRMNARFERQTFKHILLPAWLVVYRYGAKDFQALVNGHTGQVAGEYPKSWVKITLAVLLALVVLIVLAQFEG